MFPQLYSTVRLCRRAQLCISVPYSGRQGKRSGEKSERIPEKPQYSGLCADLKICENSNILLENCSIMVQGGGSVKSVGTMLKALFLGAAVYLAWFLLPNLLYLVGAILFPGYRQQLLDYLGYFGTALSALAVMGVAALFGKTLPCGTDIWYNCTPARRNAPTP